MQTVNKLLLYITEMKAHYRQKKLITEPLLNLTYILISLTLTLHLTFTIYIFDLH